MEITLSVVNQQTTVNQQSTNSSKSTKLFFRTDPNYGPKSYDKSNKVLTLSQHQND